MTQNSNIEKLKQILLSGNDVPDGITLLIADKGTRNSSCEMVTKNGKLIPYKFHIPDPKADRNSENYNYLNPPMTTITVSNYNNLRQTHPEIDADFVNKIMNTSRMSNAFATFSPDSQFSKIEPRSEDEVQRENEAIQKAEQERLQREELLMEQNSGLVNTETSIE
jgi:hypothetical protein